MDLNTDPNTYFFNEAQKEMIQIEGKNKKERLSELRRSIDLLVGVHY